MKQLDLFDLSQKDNIVEEPRPLWTSTWMDLVEIIAKRSCDPKTKVGAVIVSADNTRVLSLGYNGSPHGFPNRRDSLEDGKGNLLHAEQNAYYKLSYGDNCQKILYTLYSPCFGCAQGAIQCKIDRIVYKLPFRDRSGIELINQTGIEIYTLEQAKILESNKLWSSDISNSERKWFLSSIVKINNV